MKTVYNITANENNQILMTIADIVKQEIDFNQLISDREGQIRRRLSLIPGLKFWFDELAMGSGGVGQIQRMRNRTTRIQIGYGHGKYNYARTLVISL